MAITYYNSARSYLSFYTNGLTTGATSAAIYLTPETDSSTMDFNIVPYRQDWSTPLASNMSADWVGSPIAVENPGIKSTTGIVVGTTFSMAVDVARLSALYYSGYQLRGSREGSVPTTSEFVRLHSSASATVGYRPYMIIVTPDPPTGAAKAVLAHHYSQLRR